MLYCSPKHVLRPRLFSSLLVKCGLASWTPRNPQSTSKAFWKTCNQSDSGIRLQRLAPLTIPIGPRRAEKYQSEQENTLPARELRQYLCAQGHKLGSALVCVLTQLMIAPDRLYYWSRKQRNIMRKGSKSPHTNPLCTDVLGVQ